MCHCFHTFTRYCCASACSCAGSNCCVAVVVVAFVAAPVLAAVGVLDMFPTLLIFEVCCAEPGTVAACLSVLALLLPLLEAVWSERIVGDAGEAKFDEPCWFGWSENTANAGVENDVMLPPLLLGGTELGESEDLAANCCCCEEEAVVGVPGLGKEEDGDGVLAVPVCAAVGVASPENIDGMLSVFKTGSVGKVLPGKDEAEMAVPIPCMPESVGVPGLAGIGGTLPGVGRAPNDGVNPFPCCVLAVYGVGAGGDAIPAIPIGPCVAMGDDDITGRC